MKNKDFITGSEFDKDHFEFQHDGDSTSISHMLIYAKNMLQTCILLDNLETLHFYEK